MASMPLFQRKTGQKCRFFNAKLAVFAAFSKKFCPKMPLFHLVDLGQSENNVEGWLKKFAHRIKKS